jgi:hypothetical protein
MSNLAVVNFSVGGTLTISGKTTFAETVLSSSSASFQGLSTSNFNATGLSTFNSFLPTSTKTPTSLFQFTTKIYVDTEDAALDKKISDQKIYIDEADTALGKRITDQKTYIDEADTALGKRITDQKTYIDEADTALGKRITDQKTYIDEADTDLGTRITDQKTYIDEADTALGTRITDIGVKPIFYVHQNTNNTQTISNNVMSKVAYTTTLFNELNRYDINEEVFRPASYGGYYQLHATVCLPNITSGYIAIFKRGIEYSRGTSFSSSSTSPDTMLTISTIMYMNGSLDGVAAHEADVRVICSPSTVISGSQSKTFFTGHFIRP